MLFYRPKKSGTPEDGRIYGVATVASVEVGNRGAVVATLNGFEWFKSPVELGSVGDPRANPQHSFQPVDGEFMSRVLELAHESR